MARRRIESCLLVATLATAAACEGGSRPGDVDAGGEIVIPPTEVTIVGASNAIATVRDLEVLPDGTVWILNSVEPLFLGFGPDGGPADGHGRHGGGPGEYGMPAGFVAGGIGGGAWVFDWQRNTIREVSAPHNAPREIPLPEQVLPQGSVTGGMNLLTDLVRTGAWEGEIIVPRRAGGADRDVRSYWQSAYTADLVAFTPGVDTARTIVSLASALGSARSYPDLGGNLPFPLWFRLWAVCPGGEIRFHDRGRNELRGVSSARQELPAIALPPPPAAVSPRQFARAAFELAVVEGMGRVDGGSFAMSAADSARVLDGLIQRIDATPGELAEVLPRYVDLRCADDGTIWLQPLDLERGGLRGGARWIRIRKGGEQTTVRFPPRFDPYRFVQGRAWGVQRDELDVAAVAYVPIPEDR